MWAVAAAAGILCRLSLTEVFNVAKLFPECPSVILLYYLIYSSLGPFREVYNVQDSNQIEDLGTCMAIWHSKPPAWFMMRR